MNEINSVILQAVDTVVNARLAKQNKDTTITATIHDNSDAVFGTYIVKYQNSLFDVYSNDTNKIYKKDESVYVLVPSGDLSKRKFILGSAKNLKTESYIENTDPNSLYNLVGPELHQLYNINQVEVGIPGYYTFTHDYHMDGENKVYDFIYQSPERNDDNKLYEYSKQYEYIQFSADFKYMPAADITKCGNYGLAIGFYSEPLPLLDEEGHQPERNIIEYRFDTESMYGNPFILHDYLNYAVTVKVNKGTLYELAYITLFSEGFIRGDTITADDIFVKNVKVQFAELRQDGEEYIANILTPYGIYIDDSPVEEQGNKFIELIPLMKKQTAALNGIKYSWFEKNGKINSESDSYDPLGGRGWAKISDQDILLGDKLHYTASADWFSKRLKLVATYNDDIRREKEITIYKSATTGRYSISYEKNVENQITLKVVDAENNLLAGNDYSFVWEYKIPNGITMPLQDNGNTISFNQAEMNKTDRTYYCYLYKNDVLFDILSYTVALTVEIKEDITVQFTFGSNDINHGTFLYNENGYIEVEEFLLDRELGFIVKKDSEELKFGSYKYKWILDVNEEINNDYLTDNIDDDKSMLIYLKDTQLSGPVSGTSEITKLRYRIRPRFDRQKIKNTVTLEIIYNDTKKYFTFTFVFTKQGDPGTNGTDYQMRITPVEPGKMLQFSTSASDTLFYNIEVYHDGYLDDIDNYKWEFKLPPQCENYITQSNGEYVGIFNNFGIVGEMITENNANFKVTGSIPTIEKIVTDENNISTTYSFTATKIEECVKNILLITAIPINPQEKQFKLTYVLPIGISEQSSVHLYNYNSAIVFNGQGYSPSYSDKSLNDFLTILDENKRQQEFSEFEQEFNIGTIIDKREFSLLNTSSLYIIRQEDDNKFYLKVANKFNTDEAINTLKIIDTFTFNYEKHEDTWETYGSIITSYFPLISTINQYSLMYINEWDGNSVEIKEDEGYIYAPQIGAGHKEIKDGTNTFTGVIMGEYVIDHEEQGIGLWGFQDGVSTFGFRDNGSAYIGHPTGARLEFDGNNGFIQNAGFIKNTSGMQLDFVNGSIWTPSFYLDTATDGKNNQFVFTLGEGNNSKFLIKTADSKKIFEASEKKYVLQSANWDGSDSSTTAGLKINLTDGYLDSPYVYIDGSKGKFNLNINADNTTSQFTISAQPMINNVGETNELGRPIYKTIFKANDKAYWLKSLNYTGNDTSNEEEDITGLYINLNDGYIKSPKFRIDSNGNAYFKGSITGATGIFSGSINVGGNFIVDGTTGEVTIKKGSISFGAGGVPAPDVSGQITTALNGYATKDYVQGQTSEFVTQDDIDNAIKNIQFPTVSTPDYIRNTYIDMSLVTTPAIISNSIYSGAYYALRDLTPDQLKQLTNDHSLTQNIDLNIAQSLTRGRYGFLTGLSTAGTGKVIETEGVAIGYGTFNTNGSFGYESYVITTASGIRLQRGASRVYLTDNDFCYQKGSGEVVSLLTKGSYAVFS